MSRRSAIAGAIAAALAAVSLLVGCAQQQGAGDTSAGAPPADRACVCEPVGAPVVDPVLVAFLSKARAAHHEADLAEQEGDRGRAVQALERVVTGPVPGGASPSPEAAEVIADTRARLADLRSATGDFDRALADVDEGLKLAQATTHFRGHLFEVRGLVYERRSKALKEQGNEAGSTSARQSALDAFEKAIEIQDEVIAGALREKGGEPVRAPADSKPR